NEADPQAPKCAECAAGSGALSKNQCAVVRAGPCARGLVGSGADCRLNRIALPATIPGQWIFTPFTDEIFRIERYAPQAYIFLRFRRKEKHMKLAKQERRDSGQLSRIPRASSFGPLTRLRDEID